MEQRRIGSLSVSLVGLGCNNFGRRLGAEETARVVGAALDAGVTLFDTADVYGDGESERLLGKALAGRRDEARIATKFGHVMPDGSGTSAAWVREACEGSLRRLGTDRIDLYQVHTPDSSVAIEETLGALAELVEEGKVREIGACNFSAAQLREAAMVSRDDEIPAFASIQNELSVMHRVAERDGVLAAARELGLGFLPYFPLASGLLTGKYPPGEDLPPGARLTEIDPARAERWLGEGRRESAAALVAFAGERSHTPVELAFSWLARLPEVASVIAGATTPEQVRENAAAAGWALSDDELAAVDRIIPPGAMLH